VDIANSGDGKNQIDADAGPAKYDEGKVAPTYHTADFGRGLVQPVPKRPMSSQRSGWQVIGCMDAVHFSPLTPCKPALNHACPAHCGP
jgi:hypothetical protein